MRMSKSWKSKIPRNPVYPKPNRLAHWLAQNVLGMAANMGMKHSCVMPSVDEGIGIAFERGDRHAVIECYNTGELVGVVSSATRRARSWPISDSDSDIREALEIIDAFIGNHADYDEDKSVGMAQEMGRSTRSS